MNDINELVEIIRKKGGEADFSSICDAYSEEHSLPLSSVHKITIRNTLSENPNCVVFSVSSNKWVLRENDSFMDFLFISDNRPFKKARDAMRILFNKSVNSGSVYFPEIIDNTIDVWFAKGSAGWENTLSDDGLVIVEKNATLSESQIEERQKLFKNLRASFIFGTDGYRFVGVFKDDSFDEDGTHIFKRVDDKVKIFPQTKLDKKILVCNIGYMKYYEGLSSVDGKITGGGSYPEANNQGGEIYNFKKCEDGYTYGFVETNYIGENNIGKIEQAKKISIEKIHLEAKDKDSIGGVRVIFISKGDKQERNVIIGWYDDATVFRERQKGNTAFGYNIKCLNDDAHLIREEDREFEYPKKNEDGTYNFGQENVSYPYRVGSSISTLHLIEKACEYIENIVLNSNEQGFIKYLKKKVDSNELKQSSRDQYINSLNQISSQLIGRYIDCPIYEIKNTNELTKLYDLFLDDKSELHQINKTRKSTWSAALKQYIEYYKEKCNKKV